MAYVRKKRITATTAEKPKKSTHKGFEIDGIVYKTSALRDYHMALKSSKHVKNFALPSMGTEKEVRGKFGSLKITVNGIQFDSIMESRYYIHLLMLLEDKKIKSFERQVTIELQPKFKDFSGKTILPIRYIADFIITHNDGSKTVIDVKGVETPEFKLKKKMFMFKYPDVQFLCVRWYAKEQKWITLNEYKKLLKNGK